MLQPVWRKNDKRAGTLIIIFSVIVFTAIVILSRVRLDVNLGFDVHYFALANAVINTMVAVLLVFALIAVKTKRYNTHKRMMMTAMVLSILFLVSYICHHLFAGDTIYGDLDHSGELNAEELAAAGHTRKFYYFILLTHIPLAGVILPFILFTAYRAMTGEWKNHRRLARFTWPVWLYVAITGVIVYLMINPYYV